MNKVLIIAYAFPPIGGGGVQRSTKFVKYLRDFHWEPLVLTVTNSPVPVVDEALLQDIPEGVKIFRAASFEPSYAHKQMFAESRRGTGARIKQLAKKVLSGLLLPDVQVLWWPGLIHNLISIIKREKPQCIFVTAPPFSSFLPVVTIGKFLRIPVIVDFRDEWSFSREQLENASKGKIARALDHYFEKYVVSRCTAITAVTQGYMNTLVSRYRLPEGKGTVIANGFDEEDFLISKQRVANINSGKLTIIYSGTVWKATSLQPFIAALHEALKSEAKIQSTFRFQLFGRVVESELLYLKSPELEGIVESLGYIEHEKLISQMKNADILLLILSDLPGAEKIIAAKTFEYMATGKHIFAIVPDGETKTLLSEQYGNVTFAKPGDVLDIREKLLKIIDRFEEIRTRRGKDVSQFSRRTLTGQLAEVFNRVAPN